MQRFVVLLALTLGLSFTFHQAMAGAEEQIKVKGEPRKKVSERHLLRVYPAGKSWSASKVLRLQGVEKSKRGVFEGEQHVVYTQRYRSTVTVLENELGELKLRILVTDYSQQRVETQKKLKVADFSKTSPIFDLVVSKIPATPYVGPIVVAWGHIDPQYEKSLTWLWKRSGIAPPQLPTNTPLRIIEKPEPMIGCSFEVVWTNGLGITLVRQIAGPVDVKLDDVRVWAQSADPLFDLYIMDTLNRPIGDRWEVDGKAAVNVLSAQGARDSKGKLLLKYLKDSQFDGRDCRHLAIQGGTLGVSLDRESAATDALASQIQGKILYDKRAYLVLEADGTCHVDAKIESTNHLLFKSEWQRDVDVRFRYEAKVHNDGGT